MIASPRLKHYLAIGVLLMLSVLLGTLAFFTWDKPPIPAAPVTWSDTTRWIETPTPSYRLYGRHRFTLPDLPKAGWLRLSADSDYILYVNGQIVAQEVSIPQNTTGLGAKRSDPHQGINDSLPYRWIISDWLQVAHARDWKLTTYVDLTSYLQPGDNVIALAVQNCRKTARAVVEGAIYPTAGEDTISLTTGEVPWRLSTQPQNQQQFFWFDVAFPDYSWVESLGTKLIQETTYSRVGASLFQRPLQGNWITGQENPQGELWLKKSWQLPAHYQHAFIRYAGDEQYGLMINGHPLQYYEGGDGNKLHLYDVTKILQPGENTLMVHLSPFWTSDWSRQQHRTLNSSDQLRFFLDGWAVTKRGKMAPVQTDTTWHVLSGQPSRETVGVNPAISLAAPIPAAFFRVYEGDAYRLDYPSFLQHLAAWVALSALILLGSVWGLSKLKGAEQWQTSAKLALPTTLFLIGVGILKHRYAEAEFGLWFAQPGQNSVLLTTAVEVGVLTCLLSLPRSRRIYGQLLWLLLGAIGCLWISITLQPDFLAYGLMGLGIFTLPPTRVSLPQTYAHIQRLGKKLYARICTFGGKHQGWILGLVLILGLALRLYNLGFDNPEPDENVSWDAVQGILRTGAPVSSSGIWYTRGPVYHYLLAAWLWIVGDSLVNARLLSVVMGMATLILMFYFVRRLTKNIWIAIFVTAFLAIDPWELWYSRNIRFYQLAQFFTVGTFWAFWEGFILSRTRAFQYLFFILMTLALLSQEVTLLLLPGFFAAFLVYYRPFNFREDWIIFAWGLWMTSIYAFNIYFVKIKSLTPLVGLSSFTTAFIKLQFSDLSIFATNFFIGANRTYTIYSILFFASFIYFSIRKDRNFIFLFIGIYTNIAIITIMVFLKAARYTYPTYPIFLLLGIYGAFCIMGDIGRYIDRYTDRDHLWQTVLTVCLIGLLIFNIEPIRILNSYHDSIRPRHTDLAEYVRDMRQPGDRIISNVPAGYSTTLGGADYYLMHRMSFFDAVYKHQGRVIDRWEGGILLTNGDQLKEIMENSNRVWFHLFDRQLPKDPELARFFNQIQGTGQPILETYGAQLRLWAKDDGVLQRSPDQGGNFGAY